MSEKYELRKLVADVAAAYFTNSHVTPSEIPTVLQQIASSLSAVDSGDHVAPAEDAPEEKPTPAQIRRSVTRDALISFEDDKPYKTLRRHLAVRGLTPDQYRRKWGLPKDYPMVAPAYSEARSRMAKANGLGSGGPTPAEPTAPARGRRGAGARGRRTQSPASGVSELS